jgi:hypothetical protein
MALAQASDYAPQDPGRIFYLVRTRVHKHGLFRLLIGLTLLTCARHGS